jgi:tRNA (cytidine/uridine-2'-O-)-methyltransferase
MRLALFEPDIAGNAGTIIRLGACLGVAVDLIEPMGFPFGDRAMARAAMDYAAQAEVRRHSDWATFAAATRGRLVLLTTAGATPLWSAEFHRNDVLLLGSESAGVPPSVHAAAGLRVAIPTQAGCRSLNVAVAAAMALGEALRQTRHAPPSAAGAP